MRFPGLPVHIYLLAQERGRTQAHEMVAIAGRIPDALWIVCGVPKRRVGLLQGMELHGDIVVAVVLALERQPLMRHPGNENRQRLVENRARASSIDTETA